MDNHLIFEKCGVHNSGILIRKLADIASEEDGLTRFDHLDHSGFELFDLSVYILKQRYSPQSDRVLNKITAKGVGMVLTKHRAASPEIAEFIHSVEFAIFVSWIVNKRE